MTAARRPAEEVSIAEAVALGTRPIPLRYVAMRARDLGVHLGVSRATAYRIIERLQGTRAPDALALTAVDVLLGKGATRRCVAVLWPVEATANDQAGDDDR